MARATRHRSAPETFGARVRERRVALGLSQEKLAERADMHWTYVGQIERGERNLGLVNILRLAAALKVDAGELMKGLRA
jgi:transcriptional regulator with XRE-family HTH domain